MADDTYLTEDAIREVIRKFERCEYAPAEFTHALHLTVGCWYLCTLSAEEALNRMRTHLLKFSAHHGKHGYHETITRFWIELLDGALRQQAADATVLSRVNAVVALFPKEVLFDYYTRDRVMSDTAKREWVEPDVREIGGTSESP
jgi:hypothetical protein